MCVCIIQMSPSALSQILPQTYKNCHEEPACQTNIRKVSFSYNIDSPLISVQYSTPHQNYFLAIEQTTDSKRENSFSKFYKGGMLSPLYSPHPLQLAVDITIDRPIVEAPRKFVAIVTHTENKMHSLTHNKLGMVYRMNRNRTLRSWNFAFRLLQDFHQLFSTPFHTSTWKIASENQCSNTNWFKS
jgi:hypothetical protein